MQKEVIAVITRRSWIVILVVVAAVLDGYDLVL